MSAEPRKHSRLSPSSAHRYIRCRGAPNAEEGLPDDPSRFAAEGTAFHEIAEMCLRFGLEPEDFLGSVLVEDGFEIEIGPDMCRHMAPGLARVREMAEEPGAMVFYETRVDLSGILGEGEGGTADVTIIYPEKRKIVLWDWKYGQGVPVTAYENEQLMLYALGVWDTFAWEVLGNYEDVEVVLMIEQPRARGEALVIDGEIEEEDELDEDVSDSVPMVAEWHTTMMSIADFGAKMKDIAEETREPDAPRTPGPKQCRFCKRGKTRDGCPEQNEYLLDVFGSKFEDVDFQTENDVSFPLDDPRLLTPERRSWIVQHTAMVKKWLTHVHTVQLEAALAGEPTPMLKPVAGRNPARKWKAGSEEAAEAILLKELGPEKAYQKKVLSPTQAEAALPEGRYAKVEALVDKGTAKPTLAALSSKKPRLESYDEKFNEDDV